MSVEIVGLGGKCLDVSGDGKVNRTPIILWTRHGGLNQQWELNANRFLVSKSVPGKCLCVDGLNGNNGDRIILWDIDGGPNQKWTLNSNGTLASDLNPDRVIDVEQGIDENGRVIQLWDRNGGVHQAWSYIAASPVPLGDGVLITAIPDKSVFLVEGGQRRGFPNAETFIYLGYNWNFIQFISASLLNSIPVGAAIPTVDRIIVDTGDEPIKHQPGLGHMSTRVVFTISTGHLDAITRTRADTWFRGYHGGVSIILMDEFGAAIGGQSPVEIFGVDGTALGRSDRTDTWTLDYSPAEAARVKVIWVLHTVVSEDYKAILEKWLKSGKTVLDFVSSIGTVAQAFSSKK